MTGLGTAGVTVWREKRNVACACYICVGSCHALDKNPLVFSFSTMASDAQWVQQLYAAYVQRYGDPDAGSEEHP